MHNVQNNLVLVSNYFECAPLLKVVHAYQNFLGQNSKAPLVNEVDWSAMCETHVKDFVILIVIDSILVNKVIMI